MGLYSDIVALKLDECIDYVLDSERNKECTVFTMTCVWKKKNYLISNNLDMRSGSKMYIWSVLDLTRFSIFPVVSRSVIHNNTRIEQNPLKLSTQSFCTRTIFVRVPRELEM